MISDSPLQAEGKRLIGERRLKDAIRVLREDHETNPNDPWTPMYIGSCYYGLRDFQAALDWFRTAERLEPKNPTPLGLQGDAFHCMRQFDEARERYHRALEIAPDDELAIKNWKRFNEIEKRRDEQAGRGDGDETP